VTAGTPSTTRSPLLWDSWGRGPQRHAQVHPDPAVAAAVLDLFRDEGIDVLLGTRVRGAEGKSGREVRVLTDGPKGLGAVTGTDLLAGRPVSPPR
jgi:NADPH-dependent 2,4-dienoyl-CoA reductase/sulfur reductase-like enzyme